MGLINLPTPSHIYNIINKFSVDRNGNLNWNKNKLLGSESMQRLIIIDDLLEVGSTEDNIYNLPIDYPKYELKTLYAKNTTSNSAISIVLLDNPNGREVYKSLENYVINDIINIPFWDKLSEESDSGYVYMKIKNLSNESVKVKLELKLLNLR